MPQLTMLCQLLQVSLNNENSTVKIPVQEFLHTIVSLQHSRPYCTAHSTRISHINEKHTFC